MIQAKIINKIYNKIYSPEGNHLVDLKSNVRKLTDKVLLVLPLILEKNYLF